MGGDNHCHEEAGYLRVCRSSALGRNQEKKKRQMGRFETEVLTQSKEPHSADEFAGPMDRPGAPGHNPSRKSAFTGNRRLSDAS